MKYRISLALLVAAAGCYNPQIDRCTIKCVGTEACPDNLTCGTDGFCHAAGDGTCTTMGDGGNTQVTITVVPTGNGNGTVTVDVDPNFVCTSADVGTSTCQLVVDIGTTVMFTATPDQTSFFTTWSDAGTACTGSITCPITATSSVNVGAEFDPGALLTIDLLGNGDGSVASTPAGLVSTQPIEDICEDLSANSSGQCTGRFPVNTQMSLLATPGGGFAFGGWGESITNMPAPCADVNNQTCTFTLTADIEFGVQFN